MTVLWTTLECSGFFEPDGFVWSPPIDVELVDDADFKALQREFGSDKPRKWVRRGADVVPVLPGMRYEVSSVAVGEEMPKAVDLENVSTWTRCPGVRVLDAEDAVHWEMSGHVVVALPGFDITSVGSLAVEAPRRQPMPLYTERRAFSTMAFCFAWMFLLHFLSIQHEDSDAELPLWRLVLAGGAGLQFAWLISHFFGMVLNGVENRSRVTQPLHAAVVALAYGFWTLVPMYEGEHLSAFWVCALATCTSATLLLPLHCYCTRQRPTLLGVMWLGVVFVACVGTWVFFYAVAMMYVFLNNIWPSVAAVFLPLATTMSEAVFVSLMGKMYNKLVHTGGHPGNQSTALVCCIAVIHAYAENTRLASLLCGAVLKNDYAFLPSMALGLVLNMSARYSWSRWCVINALGLVSTRLADALRPCLACKVHDELKFFMGYPRFVVPLSLLAARTVCGLEPFFNTPALLCVFAAMGLELLEDCIVWSEKLPFAPAIARFGPLYAAETTFSPNQLLQPRSKASGAKPPVRALALHGTRQISMGLTLTALLPTMLFILYIFQLVLGMGYVYGGCKAPLDPSLRIAQAFTWDRPLPC